MHSVCFSFTIKFIILVVLFDRYILFFFRIIFVMFLCSDRNANVQEHKDKESKILRLRLSVELDQAKQEPQQQLDSQLQSLLASKDKEIESYKSKEKEYEALKEKEYEALKKENDLLKKQVAENEILKQKLTSTQEEYAHSESQGEVVVKELAGKENIENTVLFIIIIFIFYMIIYLFIYSYYFL